MAEPVTVRIYVSDVVRAPCCPPAVLWEVGHPDAPAQLGVRVSEAESGHDGEDGDSWL